MDSKKIGFIGAGKVGHSLGKYYSEKLNISGYFSKTEESAKSAAEFTDSKIYNSISELIDDSEIIFITVPDGMISSVWSEIIEEYSEKPFSKEKLFCHCSGSLTSSVLENASQINALVCSLHPVFAVSDRYNTYKELPNAYFTFEGDDEAFSALSEVINATDKPVGKIDAINKTLYHAACVFFSNLVVGIAKNGEDLFRECGLDEEFAQNAWRSLFLDNAKHVAQKGPVDALTGPAERGDISTINAHIEKLLESDNSDLLTTYCSVTKSIVHIGEERHPDRDYSEIKTLLEKTSL